MKIWTLLNYSLLIFDELNAGQRLEILLRIKNYELRGIDNGVEKTFEFISYLNIKLVFSTKTLSCSQSLNYEIM